MGAFLQFALLFVCWLAALATLLIFLESWFALSNTGRFTGRRASGAYGVISIFVPMHGSQEKVERTIRSIFGQSYPFIELLLIHSEEHADFARLATEFRKARSHIPVRIVQTPFGIQSAQDRIRALEHAQPSSHGRWIVILDCDVTLDRFAIESSVEFAGSNEISALSLRPGVQCQSAVQRIIAPSMEQLAQTVRIGNRRHEKRRPMTLESAFLLINREAFSVVNQINRMPGILNEAGWSVWSYQVEGLRTFEGDGSRWMWRDADVRSWSSDTASDSGLPGGRHSAGFVIGSTVMGMAAVVGLAFGFTHRIDNFVGASILAFSSVSYLLMAINYFLFARRLHAPAWFAPMWFLSYLPAAVLSLIELNRATRMAAGSEQVQKAHQTSKHK
ncbi:MAG TPA: glycosyltransferase [Pyrinomonadaceae bacterium]|nr:glycosyltransferase [Pyrinomonadaceae bacterium]